MAQGKQALKARIRSINSTKKITSAMELMANVKLQKHRAMLDKGREYTSTLGDILGQIIALDPELENRYLQPHTSEKKLTFFFCSDLGLCAGYNSNMVKLAAANVKKEDPMYVIGTHNRSQLANMGFNIVNEPIGSDDISYNQLRNMMNKAMDMYLADEIGTIQVVYTHFVNTVNYEPRIDVIMPITVGEATTSAEVEFAPDANTIMEELIPMYAVGTFYRAWLDTKTAEQGSRRMAMENATDNATELNDKLLLEYNQARQAAITQEITEIVGGADAL
ncbi:MAG: ATP synthase F1 subunit gamma [Erysipelotrichaceae bacterium]|nr:ATP synthase F1 subunit gamma [Erysipelotrichaceae bacterium]